MLNLLTDAMLTVECVAGKARQLTLPHLYEMMARDEVVAFPRLRAHQSPAWHALLVQLGVVACERAGLIEPPIDAEQWCRILRGLTPDWPEDQPWRLVMDDDALPAFLQPPQPKGSAPLKNRIDHPDRLDLLVTSKNHDLKQALAQGAIAEDWLFTLVSLQTQEGFLGNGNYGCARMNGGFANRSYLMLAPAGLGFGGRVFRDLRRLLQDAAGFYATADFLGGRKGYALLWLLPWDGTSSLALSSLHPLFIEVCRRVRLRSLDDVIHASAGGSKVARIDAKASKGHVGDPWLALDIDGEPKAFTLSADGFSYQRITRLLFDASKYRRPWLLTTDDQEDEMALVLEASGLVRGQGKTEGFHRRRLTIPGSIVQQMLDPDRNAHLALRSAEFIALAAAAQGKALRPALIQLFQGKEDPDWRKPSNDSLCRPWQMMFDKRVDEIFFSNLFGLIDQEDHEAARTFSQQLATHAVAAFKMAVEAAPRNEGRRDLAEARARLLLGAALKRHLPALRETEISV